jgi:hypothetical protein
MRDVSMRTLLAGLLATVATLLYAQAAHSSPRSLTATEVVAHFRAATGTTLQVDRRASYAGHYVALAPLASLSNRARYGQFVVYVVDPGQVAEGVDDLLADGHTGVLGTPGPAAIYWEAGTALDGTAYWMAKKRYGANVVLWWFGARQKVDPPFTRLHRALRSLPQ